MLSLSIAIPGRNLPEPNNGTNNGMRRARRVVTATAIMTCFLLGQAALGAASDRIWQKTGGKPIVANSISQDNFDLLKYKKGTVALTLEGMRVKAIDYGDTPESYEAARDKRDEGDFENAITLFKAAMAQAGVRPWIKLHGAYEIAETHRLWGAKDRAHFAEAIKSYDEALAVEERARIRPDIIFGRAQAHLGSGNVAAAVADLDLLASEAATNKYGVDWELTALHEKAQTLDEAGNPEEAKRAYSKLQTQARSFSSMESLDKSDRALASQMAGLARLAQGKVLIRDGKAAEARRFFEDIVADNNEVAGVRAAALVGKAEALMAQKNFKEAQVALATVRVRYYMTDALAEATYLLGLVAGELGAAEPRGNQLAQGYFLEVVQRHSGSKWARKAQEKLN
ncbi:MAG: tetratricopeptide repeat protein [Planctomycetota bacterium]